MPLTACPDCGNPHLTAKSHATCTTDATIGWMLYPFPPVFWARVTIRALAPLVAYVGPLPQRDAELLAIHEEVVPQIAYVYAICAPDFSTLYVGKTINPTGRLSTHRHQKPWWPSRGHLTLLAVQGENRQDAETAALRVEAIAIRDLRPIHNIAGVV